MNQTQHEIIVKNIETGETVHEEQTRKEYDSFITACSICDRLEKIYPKDKFIIEMIEV